MQATEAMTEQLWFVIQSMHKVWDRLSMDRFLGKQQAKGEAMKVQAKLLSDHYQYEVVEESSNYYIVYGTGGKVAVSKADYEPVQEWVDVPLSLLTVQEYDDEAYLCSGSRILFKRTWWANGKGIGDASDSAETYRITGVQRKVKR